MYLHQQPYKRTLLSAAVFMAVSSTPAFAFETPDSDLTNDLEVIVISGSKTEKALKDVAGSISVVTSEDIEKQVVTDFSQLFQYDPSVQVSGSAGSAQNVIVRGMGGDRVLMIKDGMRMNEGYGANGLNDIVGRGFIDTDTLKQVEVAKGAASSLYGSDALGGIVVFTTKDASDYLEKGDVIAGKVKLGYNELGKQTNVGGTLAFKTGEVEHLLNASARDGQEVQNFDGTKPDLDIESTSYLYKAKLNLNQTDFLSFSADIWQQDVIGNHALGLLEYFRTLDGYNVVAEKNTSKQDTQAFKLRYYSETPTAFYDLLNIAIYTNNSEQEDIEYGQLDINANFGFPVVELRDMWNTSLYKQKTKGFLSNASLALNDTHTLGYGLDIEHSESLRTEVKLYEVEGVAKPGYPQESEKFPTTEVKRAGLFINDEISLLNNQLTITPGARFDTYEMDTSNAINDEGVEYKSYDEDHVSLNLGALYKISDDIAVFAQYGQGFKVPAYDLAYINHDNSIYGYKVVPSNDLSPEKSDTYELGLRGSVNDITFSGAIFHSKYDDFLATELIDIESVLNPYTGQESSVLVYQYQNIDAVTIKGIEASVHYDINHHLSVFANAAYQDGKDDETGDYLTSISPLSGSAGLNMQYGDFSSDIIVNWAKRMTKVNSGNAEIAGHATIDILGHYALTDDLRINVAISNLFDKEYVRYLNGAGHASGNTLNNVTEPGRSVSAAIHYQF
ncbi:TonB-dependent hemoglobin/transferrin/lactoferrin family receptor [Thalassotalea sp. 1_MG-2023]|uniref:TonB-dependent hemoglobin/transferrin/lactoferrin family receptor n=1 Tax=Thalassotalea sp. 1_MG-2023 TaxID=3062680 RepID=UPI0026E1E526|nr:TonB-dependent hemoglobin/transferrin/lactoferrin family receptor [Thalassotalea sp. 1_MG-2023]MDO6426130.1 TonB-dependent hemoglobin/transferrin/lactoferrin family receptor [Thalassotalea sp. 1_MG-2023]